MVFISYSSKLDFLLVFASLPLFLIDKIELSINYLMLIPLSSVLLLSLSFSDVIITFYLGSFVFILVNGLSFAFSVSGSV